MAQYNSPKANWLRKAFWWCAGADPILLNVGTYSDQIKMACMGGTIVSTAILAFMAGTYAIHMIFSNDLTAEVSLLEYFFGVIWAFIIFNIDRLIVSSSAPKSDNDGFKKLKSVGPRILMGIVISLVISKPLELKIFEKDIELEISKNQGTEFQKIKENIKKSQENNLKIIENNLAKYDKEIVDLRKQYNNSDSLYKVELRIITVGPRARALAADRDLVALKIKEIQNSSEYKDLDSQKTLLNNSVNETAESQKASVESGLRSFVNKIKLSHKIAPEISNMITLLFIILELTPIIFKILMEKAPLDHQMLNRNKIIEENSNLQLINDKERRDRLTEKFKIAQEEIKNQFLKDAERVQEENDLKRKNLLASNQEIIKAENDFYLKSNLNNIIDLEQIEKINEKIKKAEEFAKENIEIELASFKRNIYLEIEKGLLHTSGNEYRAQQEIKIRSSPENEYDKRFPYKETKNSNSKGQKDITDALVKNGSWQKGENYSSIKVLTKNEITDLLIKSGLEYSEQRVLELFNNELNKCFTDSKIAQSRQDDSLIAWMNKKNNILKFNLDKPKIEDLYAKTKIDLFDFIKVRIYN